MGIPLICNDIGDTGYIINKTRSGVLITGFSSSEYKLVSAAISDLSNIQAEDIRQGAYLFFDLKKGVEQYFATYKKVMG